jgi:hypothetical protein
MEKVEPQIYISKSVQIAALFSVLLKLDDNQPLLRNAIFCTAQFLSKAESKDLSLQLMKFLVDKRPKIRKIAMEGMLSILKVNPMHDITVPFILNVLSSGEDTQILYILNFLKRFIVYTSNR